MIRTLVFKENTYQKIVLSVNIDTSEIQITQTYFKTEETNTLHISYDEYVNMEKSVNKIVSDSLIKQNGWEGKVTSCFSDNASLHDDENRIVETCNTKKHKLSVQIINKYVVNVIETLKDQNKKEILKVSLKELKYIFNKLYFCFLKYPPNKKADSV